MKALEGICSLQQSFGKSSKFVFLSFTRFFCNYNFFLLISSDSYIIKFGLHGWHNSLTTKAYFGCRQNRVNWIGIFMVINSLLFREHSSTFFSATATVVTLHRPLLLLTFISFSWIRISFLCYMQCKIPKWSQSKHSTPFLLASVPSFCHNQLNSFIHHSTTFSLFSIYIGLLATKTRRGYHFAL